MRTTLVIILLLLGKISNAQSKKLSFDYDSAGNQILRSWCTSCHSKTSDNDYLETDKITDSDLQKFNPEDVISYYPNPVKETLFLKWELVDDKYVTSIILYSINGQIIKKMEISNDENQGSFSFSDLPEGIYSLNLIYSDGNQKSIKIIKAKN